MSRPLELTIYPLWFSIDGTAYADIEGDRHPVNADCTALNKHLTEPELAAEYWRACNDMAETNYDRNDVVESIPSIIRRFATTPHYDQEQ